MSLLLILAIWCVLACVLAPLVGRIIHHAGKDCDDIEVPWGKERL